MSKLSNSKVRITAFVISLALLIGVVGWAIVYQTRNGHVHTVVNAQHVTTEISYDGKNGVTALNLLKKHATVTTKHYSFGDLVTSINGTPGNGPKYWTFYLNGKQASEGAGSYVTKDGDVITWKLQ